MNAAKLISPIGPDAGPVILPQASLWQQGRTLYGGASALIAYTAAIRAFPDLPPLRAAQIGFVAPVGEEIELHRNILRQGRNVTQVRSEIHCQGQVALTASWLFGTERDSNAHHPAAPVDDWPGMPDENERVLEDAGPPFIRNNFEVRRAQELRGPGKPVVRRWLRLKEASGLDPVSQIILMADALPPGSIRTMQRLGPMSSINWSFNLLTSQPTTQDGWWLAETSGEWADNGYSSERLRMWDAQGKAVVSGLQSVAIFG